MKSILILYFSGVGATKKVAELTGRQLMQRCNVDIFSVEDVAIPSIHQYDAVVVGTPCYHGAPAKKIMDYIDALPPLSREIPAFIYNTRGLCALNTNRILAKALHKKKIVTILDRAYRTPASDGTLLAPFIRRFFEFEKNIHHKISRDSVQFIALLNGCTAKGYMPRFQLGSVMNAPNKAAGQFFTLKIYLHKAHCNQCGRCIKGCPHQAFVTDPEGYPVLNTKKCENCYRCVHHCPQLALSLRKKKRLKWALPHKVDLT